MKLIEHKAKICNLSFSEYIRKSAIEKIIVIKNIEQYRSIIFEINKIGINVNQVAKLANTVGSVDKNDVIELQNNLTDLAKFIYSL